MTSPDSPFFGVPEPIIDLASGLADFVEKAVGIRPDFSPDTLSLVDHYASIARADMNTRPELSDLVAQGLGAYFGEVVRRAEGALWIVPSSNFHDWRLCGSTSFVSINAIGIGYDALFASTDHQGPSSAFKLAPEDQQAVAQRLAALPEVEDKDYFTLCTRFEVMQIIMEAVRGEQSRRGYDEIIYEPADYDTELRPLGDY